MYAVVDAGIHDDGVAVLLGQFDGRGRRGGRQRYLDIRRPPGLRLSRRGQHEGRRTRSTTRRRVGGRVMTRDRRRRVEGDGRAVLLRVALVPQPAIDVATPAQQDLLERRAEVAVETGVDDRVEKTVCVAQP